MVFKFGFVWIFPGGKACPKTPPPENTAQNPTGAGGRASVLRGGAAQCLPDVWNSLRCHSSGGEPVPAGFYRLPAYLSPDSPGGN